MPLANEVEGEGEKRGHFVMTDNKLLKVCDIFEKGSMPPMQRDIFWIS